MRRWPRYDVAKHSTPAMPVPTAADVEATVYRVTYFSTASGVSTSEVVLAFDETQAFAFADIRTAGRRADESLSKSAAAVPWATVEFKASILTFETSDEWQQRQAIWQERQAHV